MGTVTCKGCGLTARDFISHARKWIDDHDGAEAEDPRILRGGSMKEQIVLEEVLNEESGRMVWAWSVPALGLGGYCGTRSDAIADAKLCIGMQCPKD